MKTICVVTSTRAEYGLLRPLIKAFQNEAELEVKLAVTGTHLSKDFGYTVEDIEKDGFPIDVRIPILSEENDDTTSDVMAKTLKDFNEYFAKTKPDLLVALGDRYEMLAICIAASSQNVPIAHLHGGEVTRGAKDDAYRHCITKLSHLHFTSNQQHANRVIQLGEQPSKVYAVGALGVENCLKEELLSKEEFKKELGIPMDASYAMVTFHPATLEIVDATKQVEELLLAMSEEANVYFIISKANADEQGKAINEFLEKYIQEGRAGSERFILRASLGMKRYLSGLKYCKYVLGNSSSGILEAPSFKVPTINIGSRQEGRMQAKSVINCQPTYEDIKAAIKKAGDTAFRDTLINVENPYGDGNASEKIVSIIKAQLEQGIELNKEFYDLCER